MIDFKPLTLLRGEAPLLISMPYVGNAIPDERRADYTQQALLVEDTDWHLDRLYAFAASMGASILCSRWSRNLIDLNRPADGESLYPGIIAAGVCPTETFRGDAIYKPGCQPVPSEVAGRVHAYWRPYHQALAEEIERLHSQHGAVLVWEAHAMTGTLPRMFEGLLPDLNFGTSVGETCGDDILQSVIDATRPLRFTWVANGHFKGGYIVRRYARPRHGVHAIQVVINKSAYMVDSAPHSWSTTHSAAMTTALHTMVGAAVSTLRARAGAAH